MNRPTLALALSASVAACRAPAVEVPAAAPQTDVSLAEQIGSSRNARVAAPRPGRSGPLVFLAGELTDAERDELARAAPGVRVLDGLTRETALAHAAGAHGAMAHLATPAFLAAAHELVWLQAMSAGVDRYVGLAPVADGSLVLTNLRAVHGPAIADHAFGMLLALTRGLRARLEDQQQGRWAREGRGAEAIALQGRTLLVVGLGGIGSEVAQRGHGFGMRVIATRRSDAPGPDYVERVGRPEDLLALLPEADVVAICVPLTPETERLFDARAFAAMRPGAYLVNVARGRIVDTEALLAALDSGRLAGACLDVTDPEPLPPEHPLWKRADVVITPHVAADARLTDERASALLVENLRRFGAGEPLFNVVDPRAGY
jgi:phosphoglycerate dehydrogenase-like enzyme